MSEVAATHGSEKSARTADHLHSPLAKPLYPQHPGCLQRPLAVTADCNHTVTFWSVDTPGNAESAHTLTIDIDATAPTLTFGTATLAPNSAGWNNSAFTLPYTTSGVAAATPGSPLTFSAQGSS